MISRYYVTQYRDNVTRRNDIVREVKLARKNMPQIKKDDLTVAFSVSKELVGAEKQQVKCNLLKPSQHEIIDDKVKDAIKQLEKDNITSSANLKKPIVISSDNYIIDGHHRWTAIKRKFSSTAVIPTIRIDLAQKDAIAYWKLLSKYI